MKISSKITDRILKDNQFSLQLSYRVGRKQASVEKSARRFSDVLLLPVYTEFYKENGYTEEDYLCRDKEMNLKNTQPVNP